MGSPGSLRCSREVRHVEGGAPSDHGGAVLAEDRERLGRENASSRMAGKPIVSMLHEVVGPGDVREGEGDGADVVGCHVERAGEAPAAGDERLVGVLDPLGVGGRAGGVVDPADRGVVGWVPPAEAGAGRRGRPPEGRPRG